MAFLTLAAFVGISFLLLHSADVDSTETSRRNSEKYFFTNPPCRTVTAHHYGTPTIGNVLELYVTATTTTTSTATQILSTTSTKTVKLTVTSTVTTSVGKQTKTTTTTSTLLVTKTSKVTSTGCKVTTVIPHNYSHFATVVSTVSTTVTETVESDCTGQQSLTFTNDGSTMTKPPGGGQMYGW